jgi:lipoteichoic acid synthase
MIEGLSWMDFYFVIMLAIMILIYSHTRKTNYMFNFWTSFLKWPAGLVIADILFHFAFCFLTPELRSFSYYKHRLFVRHVGLLHSSAEPNWSSFHRGSIRHILIPFIYQTFSNTELTEKQRTHIRKEYTNHQERISNTTIKVKEKNIIFIIVESYLSITSDLRVDGKEVTPFLNSLRHDSTTYFNGQLTPNITVGESSDGQFLYMTGILPLRSEVTVTKAKYVELPGLPKILKQEAIITEAQMIIPTLPSMWEQESMCKKYGFDHLYTSADYLNGAYWYLSDNQIFKYALEKNLTAKQPFLSVVLTMTMHQPYTSPMDPEFIVEKKSLTEKYRNYLSTCHYTDRQIQWYLEQLKKKGLYDNSIIVIAADHHAHASLFDMEEGDISSNIPLYIVNGNINQTTGWQGQCNQLDVYTTLLDILGVKGDWKGLGHTLINNNYHESIKPELFNMSEQIILGNYFKKTE